MLLSLSLVQLRVADFACRLRKASSEWLFKHAYNLIEIIAQRMVFEQWLSGDVSRNPFFVRQQKQIPIIFLDADSA